MSVVKWDIDEDWEAECDTCGVRHSVSNLHLDAVVAACADDGWLLEQFDTFDGVTFASAECERCC